MGCYVEPRDMPREQWAAKFGKYEGVIAFNKHDVPPFEKIAINNRLPIVLVDNKSFFAVGIAIDKQEYERFTRPFNRDDRSRVIFSASIEDLKKVSDLDNYLKGE